MPGRHSPAPPVNVRPVGGTTQGARRFPRLDTGRRVPLNGHASERLSGGEDLERVAPLIAGVIHLNPSTSL